MKFIKRKSALKPITGSIVDTFNIANKTTNTYSARVIDDLVSSSGGETENIYSTTEQVIGTWIDGQTLYRKVYHVELNEEFQTIDLGEAFFPVRAYGRVRSKYNAWFPLGHCPAYDTAKLANFHCILDGMPGRYVYIHLGKYMYGKSDKQAKLELVLEYTRQSNTTGL